MIVAVDASVAVKWIVHEMLSDAASRLLDSSHELIAPDLITLEVASGLFRAARQRRLQPLESHAGFARLRTLLARRVPMAEYESDAFGIAAQYGGSIHDACYLAVARAASAPLATGDERQAATCLAMGLRVSRLENGFTDLLA